ncbi:universal stress protein [bacterium]|nr:MAG: universal stress protein [bacterium]
MSRIKKILCPTDWSEPSRVALQTAAKLALQEGADLLVIHVLPSLGLVRGISSAASLGAAMKHEAYEKLTALIAECVPSDVRVYPLIRVGEEADEIHLAALQVDVVVMSTHGRSGWAHWAFGSVAETVLLGSTCPIFVIGPTGTRQAKDETREGVRNPSFGFPFKQVLWPTDWSEPSERALDDAIAISARHGAQLLMLHVLEPPEMEPLVWERRQRAEMQERFRELCARKPEAKEAQQLIGYGVAAEEIIRIAVEKGVDLIVMSTQGRTAWQRLKLGSVAQKVVRQVPCPILLIPLHTATAYSAITELEVA